MNKNILIINGKKAFHHSHGELNQTMADLAYRFLIDSNCQVQVTNVDAGYNIEEEISKYLQADIIIYQMPAWWMGTPWIVKKYIDEVFTSGHGKLYANDGRSRTDSSKKYGSGGLLQGKKYMISITWNAPKEAFEEKGQFFEGLGIDIALIALHKANQFLGMKPLKTFICNDVIKQPKVEEDMERYLQHLKTYVL